MPDLAANLGAAKEFIGQVEGLVKERDALKAENAALKAGSPKPTSQLEPVSNVDLVAQGFAPLFEEQFEKDAAEGKFLSVYGDRWDPYKLGWQDTSKKGRYNPGIISVQNGVMNMRLHTKDGVPQVAAPQPKINGNSDLYQLYGRYEVRFRADAVDGYKTAFLLWSKSGVWPRDGEIDFPEGDLNGTIKGFMHRQGGTSGGDQDEFRSASPGRYPDWHVAVIEWTPAYLRFVLDGIPLRVYEDGRLTTKDRSTSRIPNTPMRWVLQCETELNSTYPAKDAVANVQVDYVRVHKYIP